MYILRLSERDRSRKISAKEKLKLKLERKKTSSEMSRPPSRNLRSQSSRIEDRLKVLFKINMFTSTDCAGLDKDYA